ncbi:MAG: OsmC family protein [Anaerolineales bacterium]|jgi:uncharacterized OsmC-like protein
MNEHVIVRQSSDFEAEFQAQPPDADQPGEVQPVTRIHELTPYTMMLASLGVCTTIVLHTYAQHHNIDLQEAELHLIYKRSSEDETEFEEWIEQELSLDGELSEDERQKLSKVARQCSIHKMLEEGIMIESQPMVEME